MTNEKDSTTAYGYWPRISTPSNPRKSLKKAYPDPIAIKVKQNAPTPRASVGVDLKASIIIASMKAETSRAIPSPMIFFIMCIPPILRMRAIFMSLLGLPMSGNSADTLRIQYGYATGTVRTAAN